MALVRRDVFRAARNAIASLRARWRAAMQPDGGAAGRVTVSDDEIVCERPRRPPESVRLDDIVEILLVTLDDGWRGVTQEWYVFAAPGGGCSVPSDAQGFDDLCPVLRARFPGFDYKAVIDGGARQGQTTLWRRNQPAGERPRGEDAPAG